MIIAADAVLAASRPDALLALGDTNSYLVIIAAKRRNIPIFHMEAGNRCFDMRVPEEIHRRIVDHTADINLTYSDAHFSCGPPGDSFNFVDGIDGIAASEATFVAWSGAALTAPAASGAAAVISDPPALDSCAGTGRQRGYSAVISVT